jgi:hypothetical protein
MPDTTYPVHVQLTGVDGNAFNIIGIVTTALSREVGSDAAKTFADAAFECSSYDDLLALCMRTVSVT